MSFPTKNGGSFHSYVNVYQSFTTIKKNVFFPIFHLKPLEAKRARSSVPGELLAPWWPVKLVSPKLCHEGIRILKQELPSGYLNMELPSEITMGFIPLNSGNKFGQPWRTAHEKCLGKLQRAKPVLQASLE